MSPPDEKPEVKAFESHDAVSSGAADSLGETQPVRVTGFLSLLLGLVGAVSLLGQSLVIIPVVAAALGLLAMRPYASVNRPIGYFAGAIGLFAGVLFGVWGVTERSLRDRQLSTQAEAFAGEWLSLVSQGDWTLACELQVPPARRHPKSMDLADYYANSEEGQRTVEMLKGQEVVAAMIQAGGGVRWRPIGKAEVYAHLGRQLTATLWEDATKTYKSEIRVEMHYTPPADGKPAQWTVDQVVPHVETITATPS